MKEGIWKKGLLAATFIASAGGCIGEGAHGTAGGDWGNADEYPDVGGAYASLTALTGTCTFVPMTGVMTINGSDTAQTIIIGRRAVDSAILVNGSTCGSPAATSTTLKILNVNQGMGGDQVVIIDYINGLFATGTSAARGMNVDLGAGSDSLRIRGTTGADVFTFGALGLAVNNDTSRDIDVANVESFNVSLSSGADSFTAAGGAGGAGGAFGTLVTVYGGDANDIIVGSAQDDVIYGGDGVDTITGGLGNDTISGDAGDDMILEGAATSGDDVFDGGAGNDTVSYALRTNVITVTVGDVLTDDGESGEADDVQTTVEIVMGGLGADVLTGDGGANTLFGGAGDDVLTGGAGADILNGDAGNDTFGEEAASSGGDTFNGGAGIDTVDYSLRTAALTVTMDGVTANDGESAELDNVKADVENILGGTSDDTITGNLSANAITGGDGNDTIDGGAGNDTFVEEAASNGGDVFIGGLGADVVDYSLRTNDLTVTMDGVAADDGEASEADNVHADVEGILCGDGDDTITGNALANDMDGGAGADTMDGAAGGDTIFGNAGDDDLTGGAGDDTLDGGAGDNNLTCGTGDDIAYNEGAGTRAADCEL